LATGSGVGEVCAIARGAKTRRQNMTSSAASGRSFIMEMLYRIEIGDGRQAGE
jgi:hypothetical protein